MPGPENSVQRNKSKKGLLSNLDPFFAQKLGEEQKKGPIFCPKLGEEVLTKKVLTQIWSISCPKSATHNGQE